MHTDSSASRTCMASASAVEWIATVEIPISLQARFTRRAISPRFAMRTFSNIEVSLDPHQWFTELHGLTVANEDLRDATGGRGGDRVHGLHRFDDAQSPVG